MCLPHTPFADAFRMRLLLAEVGTTHAIIRRTGQPRRTTDHSEDNFGAVRMNGVVKGGCKKHLAPGEGVSLKRAMAGYLSLQIHDGRRKQKMNS